MFARLAGLITVQSLALVLALGPGRSVADQTIYRVALVDNFYPRDYTHEPKRSEALQNALYGVVDLDRDRNREPYFHGDVVEMLVQHPQVQVLRYPLDSSLKPMPALRLQLQKLQADLSQRPLHAVLLPWESSTLISAFDEQLDANRLADYLQVLEQWAEQDPVWRETLKIIHLLEQLVEAGVEVFTIAGNGGSGMVNTLSFARGVHVIGALEPELSHFVSDNVFVNGYAPAAHTFVRIDSAHGQARGYDLNGDDCPEIPIQRLSGYSPERRDYPRISGRPIRGSSFAAPVALREALVGRNNQSSICEL